MCASPERPTVHEQAVLEASEDAQQGGPAAQSMRCQYLADMWQIAAQVQVREELVDCAAVVLFFLLMVALPAGSYFYLHRSLVARYDALTDSLQQQALEVGVLFHRDVPIAPTPSATCQRRMSRVKDLGCACAADAPNAGASRLASACRLCPDVHASACDT